MRIPCLKKSGFLAAALAACAAPCASVAGTAALPQLRVYFIGNSLTMSTTLDRVHALCGLRGIDLQFGSQISGGKTLNVLYADHIHFNPVPHKTPSLGIMISGTTVHTVLTGRNPVGLSAAPYALDDPRDTALVEQIQRIIWSVVTADPRTGIRP